MVPNTSGVTTKVKNTLPPNHNPTARTCRARARRSSFCEGGKRFSVPRSKPSQVRAMPDQDQDRGQDAEPVARIVAIAGSHGQAELTHSTSTAPMEAREM